MIVVADTSPLNFLVQIGHIDVLQSLYGRLLVPIVVRDELVHPGAPLEVRTWAAGLPDWCEVVERGNEPIASLSALDAGERAAIQLALDIHATTILID